MDRQTRLRRFDTAILTCGAVFFLLMGFAYSQLPVQPAPYSDLICLTLSFIFSFLAVYRSRR
jgi:hypothetical protein